MRVTLARITDHTTDRQHRVAAIAAAVQAILSRADEQLDYLDAKLVFDRLIDPSSSAADTMAVIDRMMVDIRTFAAGSPSLDARLAALRRFLYDPGPWNDHRAFAYDHGDPLGQRIANKLLARYLSSRRGNCVSMPALFLILAERLGLDVAFATAPLHIFIRYRSESGTVLNLETTSGAHPARPEWFRRAMPITNRALRNGLYMRSLSKREGVALLATTIVEHLLQQRRFAEALGVSAVILRHAPRDALTMVKHGTACGALIRTEFADRYSAPFLIPPLLRPCYRALAERNRLMFAVAESLGWEPVD